MSELTDCLLTEVPKISDFPPGISHPSDPVAWALNMFATNLPEADMQSRASSSEKQESKLTYFNQKDPASFSRFRERIQNTQPVHGSLPLIDTCSGDGTVRDNADWAQQVFEEQFARGLEECHPMGSYLRASLWTSCGDHRYEAHCDLTDGFLLHMSGRKRVRVWPYKQHWGAPRNWSAAQPCAAERIGQTGKQLFECME